MSTDNFPVSRDVLPIAKGAQPSRSDAGAPSNNGLPGSGFRELLSDSLGADAQNRREERRDEAQPSSRSQTPAKVAARTDHAADVPSRRRSPEAETDRAGNEAPTAKADSKKEKDRKLNDAADPADLSDKLEHANDRAVVDSHAAEGTPPAEFVAALLATETSTASAAATTSDPESIETTTITVQTPPQGLVTALAAAQGTPATEVLNKIQQNDGPPGQAVAAEQTSTVDPPGSEVISAGSPAENAPPLLATSATADATEATSTDDPTVTIPSGASAAGEKTPAGDEVITPGTSQSDNTSEATNQNAAAPASSNIPAKPAAQSRATAAQTVENDGDGVSPHANAADEGIQIAAESAQHVSKTAGKTTADETAPSDSAAAQQSTAATLNDQQPGDGSTEHRSQQHPAAANEFGEMVAQAAKPSGTDLAAAATDDAASDDQAVQSAVVGPSPTSLQMESTRTTAAAGSMANESTADVNAPDFAMRVARAVRNSADNQHHMTLRLTPPELGALRIEVMVENGKVSARIDAQTAAAQKILQDNLPQLKEAITQHGTNVERLDVHLADQSPDDRGSAMGQGFAGQGERNDAPHDQAASRPAGLRAGDPDEPREAELPRPKASPLRRKMTELDITI